MATIDNKKRILLITFSHNANYGGTLQEFALYAHLKDKYMVECLNYIDPLIRANSRIVRTALLSAIFMLVKKTLANPSALKRKSKKNAEKSSSMLKYFIRDGINLIKVSITDILNYRNRTELVNSFRNFWNEYILYTKPYQQNILFSDPPSNFDIYIAGSDQIWNPIKFGLSKVYFLRFAPSSIRKISYAPSFANFHFSSDETSKTIIEYLRDFSAISIREAHSKHELKEFGIDAEHVLDPTLLITRETWINTLGINMDVSEKPYLLVYAMSEHNKIYDFAVEAAQILSLDVKVIGNFHGEKAIPNVLCLPDTGPCKFVELFLKSTFVITNSFHGTAFSINFNIPFISVESNLPERIDSLLSLTGLTSRKRSYKNGVASVIKKSDLTMDFTYTNKTLAKERESSICYLDNAINGLPKEKNS